MTFRRKTTKKSTGGRPRAYTPEIGEYILTEIAKGRTLTKICSEEKVPCLATVYTWLNPLSRKFEKDFSESYPRARELQADTFADEIIDISDDGSNDTYLKVNKDGKTEECVDYDHIQRSKLRVESRRWRAAHALPRKYGERMQLTGAGDDPLIPQVQRIVVRFEKPDPSHTEDKE